MLFADRPAWRGPTTATRPVPEKQVACLGEKCGAEKLIAAPAHCLGRRLASGGRRRLFLHRPRKPKTLARVTSESACWSSPLSPIAVRAALMEEASVEFPDNVRPSHTPSPQVLLADHPLPVRQQIGQQVEDQGFNRHGRGSAPQFAPPGVQHVVVKAIKQICPPRCWGPDGWGDPIRFDQKQ